MILDDIVAKRKEQLTREKQARPLEDLKRKAQEQLDRRTPLSLATALKRDTLSCLCEVKKASPSKGLICEDFHPVSIAKAYADAGANAISCLTEEHYFQGSSDYLRMIRDEVTIPILRKDFLTEPYQIYETAAIGADALLLIAAILDDETLHELNTLTHSLGLEALIEVHDETEMKRVSALHPTLIGVNNRDLRTFHVDLTTASRLRPLAPKNAVFVSESGIKTNEDMRRVRENGADAVLIGETLMRAGNIEETLTALRRNV